jgi:nicotinate-nucleotide adenylyltransferase
MTASSSLSTSRVTIGLFGGTFDPVHIGHLRIALELKQQLRLDEMRLLPCHIPPHRRAPVVDAERRAVMVKLALEDCPDLTVDTLELNNPEPSFSVHTLSELRQQLGEEVSLCLAMGMDSLVSFNTWFRWQDILRLAHIIVAARPGWQLPEKGEMADYLHRHQGGIEDINNHSRGKIVVQELTLLPISSTEIRQQIASGHSAQFLLPNAVWRYIQQQQLYSDSETL